MNARTEILKVKLAFSESPQHGNFLIVRKLFSHIFHRENGFSASTTIRSKAQEQQLTISEISPKRNVVKKIPPELRRQRKTIADTLPWYQRLLERLKHDSQFLRSTVQMIFALLCVWVGIEFYFFVTWGNTPGENIFSPRPPGAEGFLPISALISLNYWIQTGIVNNIHPAGLYIFIAIALIGFFLKKAFCSWLCPIGTLSESLHLLGEKIFGRNLHVSRWLDYPLRSLKYLLLLFFAVSIWQMTIPDLKMFIESPYNKVADIKMYLFFAHMTSFALWTIIILMILSVFIENFWCRFLCPYGALLGALSWLSPLKITRNKSTCIDCELCTKVCPARISVHTATKVRSDECTSCLQCVDVCPVRDTLDIRTSFTNTRVPNWVFGTLVVGIFAAVTGLAMLTGQWQNKISQDEYLKHFQRLDSPLYEHNRGRVPAYTPNE